MKIHEYMLQGNGARMDKPDPKLESEVPGIPWAYLDDPFNDHPALMHFTYRQYLKSKAWREANWEAIRARERIYDKKYRQRPKAKGVNQRARTRLETKKLPWEDAIKDANQSSV